jgi:hypothetical protein
VALATEVAKEANKIEPKVRAVGGDILSRYLSIFNTEFMPLRKEILAEKAAPANDPAKRENQYARLMAIASEFSDLEDAMARSSTGVPQATPKTLPAGVPPGSKVAIGSDDKPIYVSPQGKIVTGKDGQPIRPAEPDRPQGVNPSKVLMWVVVGVAVVSMVGFLVNWEHVRGRGKKA